MFTVNSYVSEAARIIGDYQTSEEYADPKEALKVAQEFTAIGDWAEIIIDGEIDSTFDPKENN